MIASPCLRTLILVEGESDAGAIRALAELSGCDPELHHVDIRSAEGVTNFPKVLSDFVRANPGAKFCGMYDVADEWHVRRALIDAGVAVGPDESLEPFGFFACVADLEDELIRALGTDGVEHMLDEQGELASFRRFQAMPQYRDTPAPRQLHRFLGTRATRKIRSARRLVQALGLTRLPRPLRLLTSHCLETRRESFDAPSFR